MEISILSIPTALVEDCFKLLSFDQIARIRPVCRAFNEIASRLLNQGYLQLERHLAARQRSVKECLPRRESERRIHPLSRQVDIVAALETRQSLLAMSFERHIAVGRVCFFAGKVIDEFYRVLRIVACAQQRCQASHLKRENEVVPEIQERAHHVLQELRDLSSMAMEYLNDVVLPSLLKKERSGAVELKFNDEDDGDYDVDSIHKSNGVRRIEGLVSSRFDAAGQRCGNHHSKSVNAMHQLDIAELRAKNLQLERIVNVQGVRLARLEAIVNDSHNSLSHESAKTSEACRRRVEKSDESTGAKRLRRDLDDNSLIWTTNDTSLS